MVENINYDPGLGKGDHLALSFEYTFEYTCFTTTDPDVGFVKRKVVMDGTLAQIFLSLKRT